METPKIYAAIGGIMSELGSIAKGKRNQQQGFMYRGIDDVMNELHPLLCKHHVFVVPEILEHAREERITKNKDGSEKGRLLYSILKIKYKFCADDGSSVEAVVIGEGMDSGDKASNKAMAVAFKYACFQTFCIPTEEMPDPDAETPPHSQKKQAPPSAEESNGNLINAAQASHIYKVAHGGTKDEKVETVTQVLKTFGYTKRADVTMADYDEVCEAVEKGLPF